MVATTGCPEAVWTDMTLAGRVEGSAFLRDVTALSAMCVFTTTLPGALPVYTTVRGL